MHLYGFRENTQALTEDLLRWQTTNRPARLMRPSGDAGAGGRRGSAYRGGGAAASTALAGSQKPQTNNSTSAFTAIVEAMRDRNRVGVGVVARTGTRDAGVRGCVLTPATNVNGELIGLHMIQTPFFDDIRNPERYHDGRVLSEATAAACGDAPNLFAAVPGSTGGASFDQVKTCEHLIDALAIDTYDPADIANPTLARHYRALECQVRVGSFPNPGTLFTAPGRVHYGRNKCTDKNSTRVTVRPKSYDCLLIQFTRTLRKIDPFR